MIKVKKKNEFQAFQSFSIKQWIRSLESIKYNLNADKQATKTHGPVGYSPSEDKGPFKQRRFSATSLNRK